MLFIKKKNCSYIKSGYKSWKEYFFKKNNKSCFSPCDFIQKNHTSEISQYNISKVFIWKEKQKLLSGTTSQIYFKFNICLQKYFS